MLARLSEARGRDVRFKMLNLDSKGDKIAAKCVSV
jgi:hypothetical protein